MNRLGTLVTVFLLVFHLGNPAHAQMEESRTKIQMTITAGGKSVVTELNSFSTSLSRSNPEPASAATAKDSTGSKERFESNQDFVSLSMEVKRITDDLMKVFGKKESRFDGTITITDTYGKLPTRTFKFKQAQLSAYSEQVSAVSYGDSYSTAYLSINCPEISINGIEMN